MNRKAVIIGISVTAAIIVIVLIAKLGKNSHGCVSGTCELHVGNWNRFSCFLSRFDFLGKKCYTMA